MTEERGAASRSYRPCLLCWTKGEPTDSDLELIGEIALRRDSRSKLICIDRGTQVLLRAVLPRRATTRGSFAQDVRDLIAAVRRRHPEAEVHAVIGDRIGASEGFAAVVSRLRRAEGLALEKRCEGIVSARRCALAHLFEGLEPRRAAAFVEEQLEPLAAYDQEHGTNLLRVLELALDHHDRNAAANAAFMHRNTFRRQLRIALEAMDADIESPEERLALHLALKLRAFRIAGSTRSLAGSRMIAGQSPDNARALLGVAAAKPPPTAAPASARDRACDRRGMRR